MDDLAYRSLVQVNALPAASATYKGVLAHRTSDDTLHYCNGSSWIELSAAKLQAIANLIWAANKRLRLTGTATLETVDDEECWSFAASDEDSDIEAGTGKLTIRVPYAMTLTRIPRASMKTAPTGQAAIFDLNEEGSSIFSTPLSIDAGEKVSTTAASPAVLSDTALADFAELTVDFDQVGNTAAGAGVKFYVYHRRA